MPQLRSEETRARILAAALDCFARSGYDSAGVAAICQQAGVSKGAFYHHFASKQAVFLELLDAWLAALDRRFERVRAGAATVPQALAAMAAEAQQALQEARGQLPLFLEFYRQAMRDPLLRAHTLAPFDRYRAFFAGLIRAGIAEGSLRPLDPDAAARTILALAVGLLVQAAVNAEEPPAGGNGQSPAWTAQQAVEHLLGGIAV